MDPSGSSSIGGNRSEESTPRRVSGTVWHPAREWLEQDEEEDDMDYEPESEVTEDRDEDGYENEDQNEDEDEGHFGSFARNGLLFLSYETNLGSNDLKTLTCV